MGYGAPQAIKGKAGRQRQKSDGLEPQPHEDDPRHRRRELCRKPCVQALARAGLPATFDNLEHGHERGVKGDPLERGRDPPGDNPQRQRRTVAVNR